MAKSKNTITITEVTNKETWQKDLDTYKHSVFITPQWIESLKTNTCLPLYLDFYDNTNNMVFQIDMPIILFFRINLKLFLRFVPDLVQVQNSE